MNAHIQLAAVDIDIDLARDNAERQSQLEALAYRLWEEQGWPEGRHEEYWAEAERRLRPRVASTPTTPVGLREDNVIDGEIQDTPGRPKASSSRQQTQPSQSIQSGSPELDAEWESPIGDRRR